MPTLHLIDASPYIFRAYFAIPATLRTPAGAACNAVYGYTAFLLDLLKRAQPSHLAVAFDGSLTTSFRNDIYPAYKAQRALPPPDLEAQLEACREITAALGMRTFLDDRFEADDLIGTIIHKLRRASGEFVIVSGDKDLAQLVGPRVTLWDFAKNRRWNEKGVKQHFGVPPRQMVDWLALMGDAVDNIPGVRGIGAKTAAALLAKFHDLDELYARLEAVATMKLRGAAAIRARLEQDRARAMLSRQLATIATQAPLRVNWRMLKYTGADRGKVEALFDRLGFGRIRERIPRWQK
ncbi:MAG: exodeoxyribonuclease IX [candidate division KSB1 bacterium]|nr:exodeoxyribonuclease IX [candidate division KSB1 bacterium]MDZ7274923.1 exodeoxyribonuclease IX [candidate division KSB1 bacterium]MDZ7286625.1 exodeoxyribonuclease IX [candidate division KSB1 bacterium]MDZ7299212.1 exodeoxyribonuclease IX [candidate division KSB1 bacterium]MDZ7308345.1 exodeoxyribonuclease IX [candidate division KSB1 bacterium]